MFSDLCSLFPGSNYIHANRINRIHMNNELIALIANLALTLSFIIALVFGIAQVKTSSRDRRERLTLETLRTFQTREFAELILHVTTRNMPANMKEWNTMPFDERVM